MKCYLFLPQTFPAGAEAVFEEMEKARQWASELSSADVVEVMRARQALARLMSPRDLLELWRGGQQDAAAALLNEAEEVGCPEVYASLGESFNQLLGSGCQASIASEFLILDESHIVLRFLLAGVGHEDVMRAGCLRPALIGALAVLPERMAPAVGELFCASLRGEKILRLFDENSPESEDNLRVCEFLAAHTDLPSFIVNATLEAFESDPLLVANYLIVSGIVSRHTELSTQLLGRIYHELTNGINGFLFPFVCRACAITLNKHEENAGKYAELWGTAVAAQLDRCDPDTRDAIYDLLGAASTTQTGWGAVQSFVKEEDLLHALGAKKLCAGALSFMSVVVQSLFVPDTFFTRQILTAAWQLRVSQDDTTRERLWEFIVKCLSRESLVFIIFPLCASYLCSSRQEHLVNIRGLQLDAATRLVASGVLPPELTERLQVYISRGLYPPGSVGVETMSH